MPRRQTGCGRISHLIHACFAAIDRQWRRLLPRYYLLVVGRGEFDQNDVRVEYSHHLRSWCRRRDHRLAPWSWFIVIFKLRSRVFTFFFVYSLSFLFNLISSSFAACLAPSFEFARGELSDALSSCSAARSVMFSAATTIYGIWFILHVLGSMLMCNDSPPRPSSHGFLRRRPQDPYHHRCEYASDTPLAVGRLTDGAWHLQCVDSCRGNLHFIITCNVRVDNELFMMRMIVPRMNRINSRGKQCEARADGNFSRIAKGESSSVDLWARIGWGACCDFFYYYYYGCFF